MRLYRGAKAGDRSEVHGRDGFHRRGKHALGDLGDRRRGQEWGLGDRRQVAEYGRREGPRRRFAGGAKRADAPGPGLLISITGNQAPSEGLPPRRPSPPRRSVSAPGRAVLLLPRMRRSLAALTSVGAG